MKQPRLLLSDAAIADILEQAEWYSVQSGEALAHRWEKAVTSSMLRIVNRHTMGTLCTFKSVELRDVRRITIPGFPKHLLFYKFREGEILILRAVHRARDLERLL